MTIVNTGVGPVRIAGSPSDAEVAAIVAAIEMTWPKPAVGITERRTDSTTWRHADRWWASGRLPNRWS